MKNNLTRVIDRNLEVEVVVGTSTHDGVLLIVVLLYYIGLFVLAHNHFVSVRVNMSLTQGDWLGQDVVACSDKVNIEHLMIPDHAEHSLVVVACSLWCECNDDSGLGVLLHCAFNV